MLADLWNSPDAESLRWAVQQQVQVKLQCWNGMAMKWRWREKTSQEGKINE
ncbi:hypothetical protein O9993_06880 [Vibrio lentus]|nr:hypothetical protein [Vibrio lentus]